MTVALPLFSLVDSQKVDLRSPKLPELARQLQGYLAQRFGIEAAEARIEVAQSLPLLVLEQPPEKSLPALLALAEVQQTQVLLYEQPEGEEVRLRALRITPTA